MNSWLWLVENLSYKTKVQFFIEGDNNFETPCIVHVSYNRRDVCVCVCVSGILGYLMQCMV